MFINKNSNECGKSELNLMFTPPTQAMILGSYYVDVYPINNIDNDTPIEFEIKGSKDEYIDTSKTYLYVLAQVTDDKDKVILSTDECAPVNNLAHSLYQQVQVYYNNTPVNSSVNSYAHCSYINTLLNYGVDAKNTHLQSCLWSKDTAQQFDNIDPKSLEADGTTPREVNKGFVERQKVIALSKPFELYSRLHIDAFNTDRLLLNLVDIKIKLTKQKHAFTLMTTKQFKIKFLSIFL